jgi:NADP-dependent 3-hydroxy acid dehydrogenase YdfG
MAKKKKAVVLGVGAEKGLGAAASRRFAKEGYHVLVAGRTAAKVEKVADSIRAANGSATAVTVDQGSRSDRAVGQGHGR